MIDIEQIDQSDIVPLLKSYFQFPEETADPDPKVVPHHHDALHSSAIALPQRRHQADVLFLFPGVQPLLKLVDDDQHLLAIRDARPPPQCRQRVGQDWR